jgi:hypothetical protein
MSLALYRVSERLVNKSLVAHLRVMTGSASQQLETNHFTLT